jgi:hypothetical protein
MIVSYGSLVYVSMKEELTRRKGESGPFEHCKKNVSVPLEWDQDNEKWVIVLILDEVSIASLYQIPATYAFLVSWLGRESCIRYQ